MKLRFVKIRAWHTVKGERILNVWRTYCGRYALGDPVNVLPGGRSCEACLRIVTRLADR